MTEKVVGTMVFCVTCKSVVWAHDSAWGDLRSVCNVFRLQCPQCGDFSSFDGFRILESQLSGLDPWAKMHEIADREQLAWRNSPDLSWGGGKHVQRR